MSSKNPLEKIKKLREITGVGFKDCKIALDENKGDIEKSIELINKSYDLKTEDGLTVESIEFGKLFDEDESSEGLNAFIEKRKPKF